LVLKIGGVPEHFNLPWQLALEQGLFSQFGLQVEWTYYAGGTGAMTAALDRGDLDMAVLLTEGFLSAVNNGLQAKIVKTYIESPLVWGIYTGAENALQNWEEKADLKYAVSRMGSGSHLMAMIHAKQRSFEILPEQFQIVQSLHGGLDALTHLESDIFYWEKFMTRPFVKSGQLKMVGEFQAPWSGFLIVASNNALREKETRIKAMLDSMIPACIEFKENHTSLRQLRNRFEMTEQEAISWLDDTIWNNTYVIDMTSLENARTALSAIGSCKSDLDLKSILADWLVIK
jgi:hypothetical protein